MTSGKHSPRLPPRITETLLTLLLIACACMAAGGAGTEYRYARYRHRHEDDIQSLKQEVIALNRELFILEEELLYPSSTQVAVFLSLDVGKKYFTSIPSSSRWTTRWLATTSTRKAPMARLYSAAASSASTWATSRRASMN